jgi:preprotein translocase SecE subunit
MPRPHQHSALRRSLLVFAIASTIAFLLVFSVTLASSSGDGLYHITLDLPVFLLLLVLTVCIGDWFPAEDAFFQPNLAAPAPPTRAPPAFFN